MFTETTRPERMTRAQYNAIHVDFKGRLADGTLVALRCDPRLGTILAPVEITDERP